MAFAVGEGARCRPTTGQAAGRSPYWRGAAPGSRRPAPSRRADEHFPAVPTGAAGAFADVTALRQRTVLGSGGRDLVMVIGEAALRRRVGGANVLRARIGRLAELGGRGGPVTIEVLPFSSGAHAGAGPGR